MAKVEKDPKLKSIGDQFKKFLELSDILKKIYAFQIVNYNVGGSYSVATFEPSDGKYSQAVDDYFKDTKNKSITNLILSKDEDYLDAPCPKNIEQIYTYDNVKTTLKIASDVKYKNVVESTKSYERWRNVFPKNGHFFTNARFTIGGNEISSCLVITLNQNLTKNENTLLIQQCFKIFYQLTKDVLIPNLNDKITGDQISLRNTSRKSSLAAVMSRNMSHNIGSHVLNKLSSPAAIQDFFGLTKSNTFVKALESGTFEKNKKGTSDLFLDVISKNSISELRNINFAIEPISKDAQSKYDFVTFDAKEVKDRVEGAVKQIVGYNITPIYKLSPYFVDVNNNTTKEELARVFNDYLKKRMDFVADVATSNKALLNNSKYLFADIFRGFERNLLLLQNISGKEDKFSYQFQFQYCNGGSVVHNYYEVNDKGNILIENGKPVKNKMGFVDPIVAVPNDVLGSQAFYIILENIIRNTAKHSGSSNVIFTIKAEDLKEDDFYRITVFDNVEFSASEEDVEKYKSYIDEFNKMSMKGQTKAIQAYKLKKLVVNRNISIAQEVLDENNQIRNTGWGTIEIKLAACYLSGLDMLEMDNKMYWPIGYPAFDRAVNDNKNQEDETEKEIAAQEYVRFLTKKESKQYVIPIEGLKTTLEVTDCGEDLTRTFTKGENKDIKRYPIVQAVDGSKHETSGFGYSFLMKKPKKFLIIDEDVTLELQSRDKKGNVISHQENVTELKRLGIDILQKAPSRDSIYNHQCMIIVGNRDSKHYGDWFNLPQERLLYYGGMRYKVFFYQLKPNSFKLIDDFLEHSTLISCLRFVLGESSKRKYQVLDMFSELNNKAFRKKQIKLNRTFLFPDLSRPFNYDLPRGNKNNRAFFRHHGLEKKMFYDKKTEYAEIFGSVTPLGLLSESIEHQIKLKNDIKLSLKKEYQSFYDFAANTSIIVIDERIQSALNEIGCTTESIEMQVGNKKITEDGFSIKNKDIFLKTKIFVPDEHSDELDLNNSDLKSQRYSLKKYIENTSKKVKADYLIIHFGIIEGLRNSNENDSVIRILEEIKTWIKSDSCKIIITSGRGYTPDIKKLNQYFIAYSTVSNLLLDPNGRAKGHLVKCLKQLRKLNK